MSTAELKAEERMQTAITIDHRPTFIIERSTPSESDCRSLAEHAARRRFLEDLDKAQEFGCAGDIDGFLGRMMIAAGWIRYFRKEAPTSA